LDSPLKFLLRRPFYKQNHTQISGAFTNLFYVPASTSRGRGLSLEEMAKQEKKNGYVVIKYLTKSVLVDRGRGH
jgi:hypothetical protein